MGSPNQGKRPPGRDIFEGSFSGAQDRPFIPRLRSDSSPYHPLPRSLEDFRQKEGVENRDKRLHSLWCKVCHRGNSSIKESDPSPDVPLESLSLTRERAVRLTEIYEDELRKCTESDSDPSAPISWEEFKKYAERKEAGMFYACTLVDSRSEAVDRAMAYLP